MYLRTSGGMLASGSTVPLIGGRLLGLDPIWQFFVVAAMLVAGFSLLRFVRRARL